MMLFTCSVFPCGLSFNGITDTTAQAADPDTNTNGHRDRQFGGIVRPLALFLCGRTHVEILFIYSINTNCLDQYIYIYLALKGNNPKCLTTNRLSNRAASFLYTDIHFHHRCPRRPRRARRKVSRSKSQMPLIKSLPSVNLEHSLIKYLKLHQIQIIQIRTQSQLQYSLRAINSEALSSTLTSGCFITGWTECWGAREAGNAFENCLLNLPASRTVRSAGQWGCGGVLVVRFRFKWLLYKITSHKINFFYVVANCQSKFSYK